MKCPCCGSSVDRLLLAIPGTAVLHDGRRLTLRNKEVEILSLLLNGPIYSETLGYWNDWKRRSFQVHLSRLRRKLHDENWPFIIVREKEPSRYTLKYVETTHVKNNNPSKRS